MTILAKIIFLFSTLLGAVLISCSSQQKEKVKSEFLSGTLFQGKSDNQSYNCYFEILQNDSLLFIYETEDYSVYGEHRGTLKRLNDSTFHVSATLEFGHYICKGLPDSLLIFNSTPNILNLSQIIVQYDNEEIMTEKIIQGDVLAFGYNSDYFNGKHLAKILINKIHPITYQPIVITTYPGSASDFASGDKLEFDVIISDNIIKTTGTNLPQTESFLLKSK